jgi:hypothetical protein
MPYCPQCGYEYEADVTFCPDCNKQLVAEPPKHPVETEAGWPPADQAAAENAPADLGGKMEESLVVIYEAPDEYMSRAVRDILEEAGLPVIEQVDRTKAYDNLDFSLVGRYSRLLVLESCAEEAREIVTEFLAAYNRGDLALPDEDLEDIVDLKEEEEK